MFVSELLRNLNFMFSIVLNLSQKSDSSSVTNIGLQQLKILNTDAVFNEMNVTIVSNPGQWSHSLISMLDIMIAIYYTDFSRDLRAS